MNFQNEFRNAGDIREVAAAIRAISRRPVSIMEVCGGHTMAIHRYGIHTLLPGTVTLKSGPGCPVCVSSKQFVDYAVALARLDDVMVTTFGDLIRVPGSSSSLERERANGRNVQIVYSPLEALALAKKHPERRIVFLGIGFETTAPTSATAIQQAQKENIASFFVLSSHKIMPPVMAALIDEGVAIDGYLCPGHVSVITGSGIYEDIAAKYGRACVISGFEPLDIMMSIYMLVRQIEQEKARVEIQYRRAVRPEGNPKARAIMQDVFVVRDDWWRGIGVIPASGLGIAEKYAAFDAEKMINVAIEPVREVMGCICGSVLKGVASPKDCKLFGKACTPSDPVGACMVSSEGACAAFYKYQDLELV